MFISSITVGELLFGIGVLPEGKRRATLASRIDRLLAQFDERVLPFDTKAAKHFADLAVAARAAGRGFPTPDGYIAAIAAAVALAAALRHLGLF